MPEPDYDTIVTALKILLADLSKQQRREVLSRALDEDYRFSPDTIRELAKNALTATKVAVSYVDGTTPLGIAAARSAATQLLNAVSACAKIKNAL